jgi:hypothetical protein
MKCYWKNTFIDVVHPIITIKVFFKDVHNSYMYFRLSM